MNTRAVATIVAIPAILIAIGFTNVLAHNVEEEYVPSATEPAVHGTPTKTPAEDDPHFDCRKQGNRICGPGSGHRAGCYRDGVIVIPWTNYKNPKADPLYGQLKSPC